MHTHTWQTTEGVFLYQGGYTCFKKHCECGKKAVLKWWDIEEEGEKAEEIEVPEEEYNNMKVDTRF